MTDYTEIATVAREAMELTAKAEQDTTDFPAVYAAADAECRLRNIVTPATIIAMIEENAKLRNALAAALPYVKSMNSAEHMRDGFGPVSIQPSDVDLEIISSVLGRSSG